MDFIYTSKKKSPPTDMPSSHSHTYYELYYQISGERQYFIEDKIYDINPGDLVIIKPHELHRTVSSNKNGYERYIINFNQSHIKQLELELGKNNVKEFLEFHCLQFTRDHSEYVKNIIAAVDKENHMPDKYSVNFKQNTLSHLVLACLRHGISKNQRTKDGADKIQDVTRYINENYNSKITLHDVAQMAFMEDTYFSKKFKQLTGFGFNEYLTQIRIRAAESLLTYSDNTVSEISEMCGFSSANYFGDIFRSSKGISPSQYRKKFNKL